MKRLLAVYGSLKKGLGNHHYLENSNLLGTHNTEAAFQMYSLGGYPAVTKDGETSLTIEVYEVDDATLKAIYRLEGYSGTRNSEENWYDTLDVDTPWGKAEMFYFKGTPDHHYGLVGSGNWTGGRYSSAR